MCDTRPIAFARKHSSSCERPNPERVIRLIECASVAIASPPCLSTKLIDVSRQEANCSFLTIRIFKFDLSADSVFIYLHEGCCDFNSIGIETVSKQILTVMRCSDLATSKIRCCTEA